MLSGFNTNIRHRDVLFHVQTEDSGARNPHIITHLFHGGNILASEKRDYSGQLGAADLEAVVRSLMDGQHKAMIQRLKRGDYDALLRERLAGKFPGDAPDTATTLPPDGPDAADATDPGARPKAPPPEPKRGAPARAPAAAAGGPAAPPPRPGARAFGERVVSSKPLDEVVLEYLVENARKRKRSSK